MSTASVPASQRRMESSFLSCDPAMERIREIAGRVADKDVPVLVLGESGVGKEVVARYLHSKSERLDRPFVKINCAAVPHDLLESELFGHERGAFTGADRQKAGQFELAEDGTILLDEIGEMDPLLQAKLLHVLQDRHFRRVGGKDIVEVEARVIATTNKRLDKAVAAGEFREDLFFRLAVILLEIPPLRNRPDDILLLTDFFFKKYSTQYGATVDGLPKELSQAFLDYAWPGNVRQLENLVRRYVLLPEIEAILTELENPTLYPQQNLEREALRRGDVSLIDIGAEAAEQAEKRAVLRVLEETNWNRKQAAERLNVCYKTLLNKLSKWELHEQHQHAGEVRRAG